MLDSAHKNRPPFRAVATSPAKASAANERDAPCPQRPDRRRCFGEKPIYPEGGRVAGPFSTGELYNAKYGAHGTASARMLRPSNTRPSTGEIILAIPTSPAARIDDDDDSKRQKNTKKRIALSSVYFSADRAAAESRLRHTRHYYRYARIRRPATVRAITTTPGIRE